jgi:muramoyltetrapeptide carboxypeptidase
MPALAPLRRGSTIALVSMSGPLRATELASAQAGADYLQAAGWTVDLIGPTGGDQPGSYLAGSDSQRIRALRRALKHYDAVLFTRGGYGATRLLDYTGWDKHQPWLMGFSDATALLWARYSRGLQGGVHGPCASNLTHHPDWSIERACAILRGEPVDALPITHLCGPRKTVSAPIIAGNLTVATALIGTPFFPDISDHVVVFEDVNEPPYKVDRLLTQWRSAGLLRRAAALGFGTFDNTPNPMTYETIAERTQDLGIPVFCSSDIGHHGVCAAVPIGRAATVTQRTLRVGPLCDE